MGYTTDFLGHLDISPALNQDEVEYLTAFAATRHFDRAGGPYEVSGNPYVDEDHDTLDVDRYNRLGVGQPQLWCQWVPCWEGCCLAFDGHEKFYAPIPWLRYLIGHFLKPGAAASRSGLAAFEHFTFDHVLDGMMVGCRRDTRELFAITVRHNRVTKRVLRPGGPDYQMRPPLPYEIEREREAARSRRRRRGRPPESEVVDLAGWRRASTSGE